MGPLRWGYQRLIKPRPAATLHSQISKEHSHRSQNHSDGIAAIMSIPLCNEIPQAIGRIRLWIISEKLDQIGHEQPIGRERCLNGSPVNSHPLKELTYQDAGFRGCLRGSNLPLFPQMAQKNTDA
jgi:hypothetical protein